MSNTVTIKITTNCGSMLNFFQNDASHGTRNKPCRADNFSDVSAIGATTTGIRNVFKLASDTVYKFQLINASENTYIDHKTATFTLSIIQMNIATKRDWDNIIDLSYNQPEVNVNGGLSYKAVCEDKEYFFLIKTLPDDKFQQTNNLQYNITFQVTAGEKTVLAVIDPLIANTSDD